VCSTGKVDLVRSIGADHVIDYTRKDFADGSRRYDLVLDIGGNSPLSRRRRVLTPKGTLVIVGGEGGAKWTGMSRQIRALALSPFVRQRLTMFVNKERHTHLEALRPCGVHLFGSCQ
jgi:NADPH:quinone reductase-like Zn-dependent oxidoreductase